jgi:hypothetical protein
MQRFPPGKALLRSSPLHRTVEEISLVSVNKGMFALLALLVALHAGFACGMAQGAVAIKAPCCGANCPVPSSAGDRACCQAQNSGAAAEALSAKASLPSLRPVTRSIRLYAVMPALSVFEEASVFQSSPPGARKLALLCSRQI